MYVDYLTETFALEGVFVDHLVVVDVDVQKHHERQNAVEVDEQNRRLLTVISARLTKPIDDPYNHTIHAEKHPKVEELGKPDDHLGPDFFRLLLYPFAHCIPGVANFTLIMCIKATFLFTQSILMILTHFGLIMVDTFDFEF